MRRHVPGVDDGVMCEFACVPRPSVKSGHAEWRHRLRTCVIYVCCAYRTWMMVLYVCICMCAEWRHRLRTCVICVCVWYPHRTWTMVGGRAGTSRPLFTKAAWAAGRMGVRPAGRAAVKRRGLP